MKRLIIGAAIAAGTLVTVAASFTVAARPASADETLHTWGINSTGDTCEGKCGPTNICCRIVIVIPN